jgi:hypothetical protein
MSDINGLVELVRFSSAAEDRYMARLAIHLNCRLYFCPDVWSRCKKRHLTKINGMCRQFLIKTVS